MGKFKDIEIEEYNNILTRTFKSKDQLPIPIKDYLKSQGYYLSNSGLSFKEERAITSDNLYFIGHTNYYSEKLTYTISCKDNVKKMIIKTDVNYSFFEMVRNSFVEEEY